MHVLCFPFISLSAKNEKRANSIEVYLVEAKITGGAPLATEISITYTDMRDTTINMELISRQMSKLGIILKVQETIQSLRVLNERLVDISSDRHFNRRILRYFIQRYFIR